MANNNMILLTGVNTLSQFVITLSHAVTHYCFYDASDIQSIEGNSLKENAFARNRFCGTFYCSREIKKKT